MKESPGSEIYLMDPFRSRLLSVSNGITDHELGQLKFVCKQHIPVGVLERIVRPLDLFDELENRNLLSEDNTRFLAELLTEINRLELKEELFGVRGKLVSMIYFERRCFTLFGWSLNHRNKSIVLTVVVHVKAEPLENCNAS